MNIGVAANGNGLDSFITDQFKKCNYLLIIGVKDHYAGETAEITGITAIKNEKTDFGMKLAKELVKHNCEAVITGELDSSVFDFIADTCITRYNGAGYPVQNALELMERRELKLIRNREGTDECDDSHHNH